MGLHNSKRRKIITENNIAATTNLLNIKNLEVSLNKEGEFELKYPSKIGRLWQEELWYNLLRVSLS